ncbi:MAG: hypothetical protein IJP44_03300 [Bacteroidales bacterium]|nr:hypothetical protein [Bacteroidales bacterium]
MVVSGNGAVSGKGKVLDGAAFHTAKKPHTLAVIGIAARIVHIADGMPVAVENATETSYVVIEIMPDGIEGYA